MSSQHRVFIAGSRGFIGQAVSRYLNSHGHSVFGVDRRICENQEGFWSVDLLDVGRLSMLLEESSPDYIFHVAGLVGSDDENALYLAHVETTRALLTATKRACPSARVIVLGSAAEYGTSVYSSTPIKEDTEPIPETPYGRSKLAQSEVAQQLAVELHLDLIRVRVFNTLGPGQGPQLVGGAMVKRLYKCLTENVEHFEVYDPFSERDYLDVRDVARLLWLGASRVAQNSERPPIHIASGKGAAVVDLARWLLQAAGVEDRLSLRLVPGQARTSLIGESTTLAQLIGKNHIQRFSLYTSLCDMWEWEVQKQKQEQ